MNLNWCQKHDGPQEAWACRQPTLTPPELACWLGVWVGCAQGKAMSLVGARAMMTQQAWQLESMLAKVEVYHNSYHAQRIGQLRQFVWSVHAMLSHLLLVSQMVLYAQA